MSAPKQVHIWKLPMLQGPCVLPKDCSDSLASHLPLLECSLPFLLQHRLRRECINYHGRGTEVSSSFRRPPPPPASGFQDTKTCPHSHTLTPSFCHSCLSLWQQMLYDGRVDDAEGKLTLLRIRCLLKASCVSRGLANHIEKFGSHRIAQTSVLGIIYNIFFSHVASKQSTASSLLTRILPNPSPPCRTLFILHA